MQKEEEKEKGGGGCQLPALQKGGGSRLEGTMELQNLGKHFCSDGVWDRSKCATKRFTVPVSDLWRLKLLLKLLLSFIRPLGSTSMTPPVWHSELVDKPARCKEHFLNPFILNNHLDKTQRGFGK